MILLSDQLSTEKKHWIYDDSNVSCELIALAILRCQTLKSEALDVTLMKLFCAFV